MTFFDKYPKLAVRKDELGQKQDKTDREWKEWHFVVSIMMIDDVISSFDSGNRKFMSYDVGMVEGYAKDLMIRSEQARIYLKKIGA